MTVSVNEQAEPQPRSRAHRLATLPDEQRTRLIFRAASDLFADHGYVGTTMREIADTLEVRAPSLYTYFPSKQHLLDELALATTIEGTTELRAALSIRGSARDRLVSAIEHQVRYRLEHPTALLAVTRSIEQLTTEVRERVLDERAQMYRLWEGVVRDGVEEGLFAVEDPHVTGVVLNELCNYVQVNVLSEHEHRKPDDLVRLYGDIALKIVAL